MISGTNLAKYVGAGTFTLGGFTLSGTSFTGGGGNIKLTQVTKVLVTAEVDYTYFTPAPEPSTVALMGSALLGLGVMRKRLRK